MYAWRRSMREVWSICIDVWGVCSPSHSLTQHALQYPGPQHPLSLTQPHAHSSFPSTSSTPPRPPSTNSPASHRRTSPSSTPPRSSTTSPTRRPLTTRLLRRSDLPLLLVVLRVRWRVYAGPGAVDAFDEEETEAGAGAGAEGRSEADREGGEPAGESAAGEMGSEPPVEADGKGGEDGRVCGEKVTDGEGGGLSVVEETICTWSVSICSCQVWLVFGEVWVGGGLCAQGSCGLCFSPRPPCPVSMATKTKTTAAHPLAPKQITHPLDYPPPLPAEHLAPLDPPLPRPQRRLQHAVRAHREPQHWLALLEREVVRARARGERDRARGVAQG